MFDQLIASLGKTRKGFTLSIREKQVEGSTVVVLFTTEVLISTDADFHMGVRFTTHDAMDKIRLLTAAVESYHPSK